MDMEIDNPNPAPQQWGPTGRATHFGTRGMSEASTATLRAGSLDIEMLDAEPLHFGDATSDRRFIVSVDFGTTFSCMSFVALPHGEIGYNVRPRHINTVVNYPDEPPYYSHSDQRKEVPTEIWYPSKSWEPPSETESRNDLQENGNRHRANIRSGNHSDDENDNADDEPNDEPDDENPKDYFWGYGVQKQLKFPDTHLDQKRRIRRSKLLLDNSERTEHIRNELGEILKVLKKEKLIKNEDDIIADYLEHLFRHAKDQLTTHHGFSGICPVEFVLCVPAIWTQKASRRMQKVMEIAIRRSGFGSVQNGSVENLFIVSEPEAASAYVLAADPDGVKPGETFVLLDAGGGTVDAITYRVSNNHPLRLEREAFLPGGDLCGSSYLNEAFQINMLERLKDERYLEKDGLTIESIVDRAMVDFENDMKRKIDVAQKIKNDVIWIQGLRANSDPEKRFNPNRYKIEPSDFRTVFWPVLQRVAALMHAQLDLAKEKGLDVKKVILIGGFAASPSLRNYLSEELSKMSNCGGGPIKLIGQKHAPETAVASGAVLRALNKAGGPARTTLSSYGFLRTEPHEPELYEAHKEVKRPYYDPLDGDKYVKNTIDWLIKKGEIIPPQKEHPITVVHTFALNSKRLICADILYVSDTSTESHYRRTDPRNAGAEIAGRIESDMTFLKTEGLIVPVEPEGGMRGKKHYRVEYELVMIIDGRNLRYEARYPAGGAIQSKGQISIAAAFVPGTD